MLILQTSDKTSADEWETSEDEWRQMRDEYRWVETNERQVQTSADEWETSAILWFMNPESPTVFISERTCNVSNNQLNNE